MDKRLRALNRFGLGARPGERQGIGDPREWLRTQLEEAPGVTAPAAAPLAEAGDALQGFRQAAGKGGEAERREARQRIAQIAAADARAALTARLVTPRPFVERLVGFWSNHLCVSAAGKVLVAPLAGSYERDVIRPHVLGRFEDMVVASAKHPAMLVYLDNFQSVGPNAPGIRAGRGNARRGLNENYARELLELHTLGVDGGYVQQDVLELAKLLTGWTAERFSRFVFRSLLHEPGPKTILGVRYGAAGIGEGERAIRALCRHDSTAQFVAAKLVAHFVADDPPGVAVGRIAAIFRKTAGDLRAVSAALVDLPEAWAEGARKFRTPQDWLVAAFRALGRAEAPDPFAQLLRQLRHPLWSPPSPKGYGDTTRDWADPDALLNRAELARTFARRFGCAPFDPSSLLEVVDVAPGDPVRGLLGDRRIPPPERVALALAGPAFQWR